MNAPTLLGRMGLALGFAAVLSAGIAPAGRAQNVLNATPDGATEAKWSDIKGDTYDQRAHFAAGLARLSDRLNEDIRLLKAKRAGMTTDTKDWDFAMKDVMDSRELLTGRMNELGKTNTPEGWSDAKDKVGEAWQRALTAVDKMHTTVTS